MAGKKKSKANKLARMSEEEKLRYLQQRAAAEEEARRRKEQLLAAFVKNKLKHEDAFSRLNSAKINQQWRQTLRQIKNNELHEAAETLHQTFDVAIQTKNKIINTLLEDLSNSVSMHRLAVQTHLEFINKIIGIWEGRLETLQAEYQVCREDRLKEAVNQAVRGRSTYSSDKESLLIDIHWQTRYHVTNAERIETLAQDYRNDYKYKALSETKREEEEGSKKIDHLQAEMKQTLKNYHKSLAPFLEHYEQLKESDALEMEIHLKSIRMIRVAENKIKKAQQIKLLSEKYLKKNEEEFIILFKEKKNKFDWLREKVKEEQNISEKAIKHLSTTSGSVLKDLELLWKQVNNIVNVHKTSKKYLTGKELHCSPEWLGITIDHTREDVPHSICEDETTIFWKLYTKVANEVETLSARHATLLDENLTLKHSLTKYMNTLAKPSSLTSCIYRDTI